ncbi:recombinase family protein [Desulfosporosinus sp. Sb-LF]|uniref:recombinase family protein n=1 Tax=Desulfosporosinus sp. Sb-LF TaxID=2560027 RepID=UPI00107F9C3A|nr:recombinase family protein [Desulfosporosinus sp. Sb-LF]TGE31115.1 recombinase family protein [Desulfosporosinus sp. Sb-LF]
MNIAYIRVSSVDQNEERQLKAMEKENIKKYFIEKVSAKDTKRPKLLEMIEFAREGDTIFIKDFSRLARSTQDLLNIVKDLDEKGVKLKSLKENLDTNTSTGKLMLTMIGAINEFERANMLERQREGIAIAKAKGAYKGRKRIEKPDNWQEIYTRWKNRELTANKAMELLCLKRNTFYKLVTEVRSRDSIQRS